MVKSANFSPCKALVQCTCSIVFLFITNFCTFLFPISTLISTLIIILKRYWETIGWLSICYHSRPPNVTPTSVSHTFLKYSFFAYSFLHFYFLFLLGTILATQFCCLWCLCTCSLLTLYMMM